MKNFSQTDYVISRQANINHNKSSMYLTCHNLFWHSILLLLASAPKKKKKNQKKIEMEKNLFTDILVHSDSSKLMKNCLRQISYNWDLLVFGPEFAMLRTPRPVWDKFGRNSSLKGFPQNDSPPGDEENEWDRRERHKMRWRKTQAKTSKGKYINSLKSSHFVLIHQSSNP